MTLLPFDLSLPVGASVAVFALGVTAWWRNKWSRGNVVFALMTMSLASWVTVDWFRTLETTALPDQVMLWRLLYYLGVALGPALAIHASSIIGHRKFRWTGWSAYALSISFFVAIDTAFLLRLGNLNSPFALPLLDWSAFAGFLLYVAALFVVAINLYPVAHATSGNRLDRRRTIYGLMISMLYLIAGMLQFVSGPFPLGAVLTGLAALFFIFSAMAFAKVQLLDVDFSPLEAFLLVLSSAALVLILRSKSLSEGLVMLAGAVIVGAFGVMSIVTVRGESLRRRKLETLNHELAELDEAKTDFVAIVAHQLRGPLGGIRFAADMLKRGDYGELPERAKDVAQLIEHSSERLLSLAETSLNAARMEVGAFQPAPSVLDIVAEIRMLLAEVEPFAKTKGLSIISSFDGIPPRLETDREILRNVVFNLIDNAIKYTERGEVRVSAVMQGNDIVLTVTDSGTGLTSEDIKKLFQRFHRGNTGSKHKHDGAGLGLYVVKSMLDAVHGTVQAASEGLGKGSTFTVDIPVRLIDEGTSTQVRSIKHV